MRRNITKWYWLSMFLIWAGIPATFAQTTFTEKASSWGIDLSGSKDGGLSFGDYDNDGDLDLLVNTSTSSKDSRLYRNNGNSTFTDVTSSKAPYLLNNVRERSAVWGDLNNDGYLDFLRNTSAGGIEIYLQKSSNNVFGNGTGGTTPIIFNSSNISNGVNTEGAGVFDFDGDGDLDILFDNHNYGVDILRNNYINHSTGQVVDPSSSSLFTHATPGSSTILGLAQSARDGDYGSVTDVDNDGWVDIFMRKQNENDFFLNQGGTFTNGIDLAQPNNSNKGAVAMYDFDNDGDFDAFWTDDQDNKLFRNDGAGVWTSLGSSTNIPTSDRGIDEVVCGDIDNDGDIDILLLKNNGSELWINQINSPGGGVNTGTAMTFSEDNSHSIISGENGEGAVMVDIDQDGDLDIYINVKDDNNELWINNLYSSSTPESNKQYLFVEVLEDRSFMQSGKTRPATGATLVLLDCNDQVISGIREVNGGNGHGTQDPQLVHFGLPYGTNYNYKVKVLYPNYIDGGSTTREEVIYWIKPSEASSFPVQVTVRATDSDTDCPLVLEICDNNLDDDNDGLTDSDDPDCPSLPEDTQDTDGDGVKDSIDKDDDNDGIPDIQEIYAGDHDSDGTPDYADAEFCATYFVSTGWDCDGGLPDPSDDIDANEVRNYTDSGFPGCGGISNGVCSNFDTDGDGIPNHLDLDSDNDGISDLVEAGGTDSDTNGQVDCQVSGQTYTVSLTVTDDAGCSSTHSGTVTVGSGAGSSFASAGTTAASCDGSSGSSSACDGISFEESSGIISIEAENYDANNQRSDSDAWEIKTSSSGYSGTGYVNIPSASGIGSFSSSAQLTYETHFTSTGTFYVYARVIAPNGSSNSGYIGVAGNQSSSNYNGSSKSSWTWVSMGSISISSTGTQTIELVRREDDFEVDKIVFSTTASTPTGTGPSETSCSGSGGSSAGCDTDAEPSAGEWIVRNNWSDQDYGSGVSNASSALKLTHRAWGKSQVLIIRTGAEFSVTAGEAVDISFDVKTHSTINQLKVGIADADDLVWHGPSSYLAGLSPVSNGYSSSSYVSKSISLTPSSSSSNAVLVIRFNGSRPREVAESYLQNLSICSGEEVNQPPTAKIQVTSNTGSGPYSVQFSSSGSSDSDGSIASYSWDFGDGNTSTDQHPSHDYTIGGITDTDEDGWCDTYDNQWESYTSGSPLAGTDSDGDVPPDFLETDADNDGCYDTKEAEVSDGDEDGIAGTGSPTINSWGQVSGQAYPVPSSREWQNALLQSQCNSCPYIIINPHVRMLISQP